MSNTIILKKRANSGLYNSTGRLCWLNSAVQIVQASQACIFIEGKHVRIPMPVNYATIGIETSSPVINAFRNIVHTMANNEKTSTTQLAVKFS